MAMVDPLAQYRFGGANDPRYANDRRAAFASLAADRAENARVAANPRAAARERDAVMRQVLATYGSRRQTAAPAGIAPRGRRSTGNT